MKLITNLSEMARLSEINRKKDFDFRAKLKWKADGHQLDADVQGLFEEIAGQIDCRTCGNCCKTYEIILTDRDIKRLSTSMGLAYDDFRMQHLKRVEDEDGLCFNTKPCPLLINNQCSQYEARPDVCREYPHLDKTEFLGRTWSVIDNCSTCPQVFNVWNRLKREFF